MSQQTRIQGQILARNVNVTSEWARKVQGTQQGHQLAILLGRCGVAEKTILSRKQLWPAPNE